MPLSNAVSNVQKEGEGVKGVLKDVKKLHNLQNGTSLRLNIPKILSKSKIVFDFCLIKHTITAVNLWSVYLAKVNFL